MTNLNNSGGWENGFYNLSESTRNQKLIRVGCFVSLKKTLVPGDQPWYRVHSVDFDLELFQVELVDHTIYPLSFRFDDIKQTK